MKRPERLKVGDTVGIISPCYLTSPESIASSVSGLEKMGFKVKISKNCFSDSFCRVASPEERASDIHDMFLDDEVRAIIFNGGEFSGEVLPYLDYGLIGEHPKIFASFSDSTTPMNAITALSGIVTMYGTALGTFGALSENNEKAFRSTLMEGNTRFCSFTDWTVYGPKKSPIHGKLIGGYMANFVLMLSSRYLPVDKNERYILVIEDYTSFSNVDAVERYFAHIVQSELFPLTEAIFMGSYDSVKREDLDEVLERYANRYSIPIIKNDDFGHDINNSILPLGLGATLDLDAKTLDFDESPVI